MSIAPIPPIAAAIASPDLLAATRPAAAPAGASFSQILLNGIEGVNQRVVHADAMVRAFAIDDSVPLHQVTFALEEARLSVELMMQVRARLVESYQRMMEMQL
jgi:flagellar hook-basal body complex protein FliE